MPAAQSVKRWLAPVVKTVAPRRYWRRKYGILERLGETHPDVQLARSLCDPKRVSLDIGASIGEFTIAMLGSSRAVIAFEPRPVQARELRAMFAAVGAPVRVEAVALSDQPGVTTMRVVPDDPGRSTIDDGNTLGDLGEPGAGGPVQAIDVPVKRLDDLQLDNVGLVKVDVEGHELAVLRGGAETLTRNRPAVLVEAEERHHPDAVAAITEFLSGLGYAGYFDIEGTRRPVEEFDAAQHQNPANIGGREDGWALRGVYVNNFVFHPTDA